MSAWISVKDRLPKCELTPDSFGVAVLVYPPFREDGSSEMTQAFYGCRQSSEPNFYIFGRIFDPTHWQPLPEPPKEQAQDVLASCPLTLTMVSDEPYSTRRWIRDASGSGLSLLLPREKAEYLTAAVNAYAELKDDRVALLQAKDACVEMLRALNTLFISHCVNVGHSTQESCPICYDAMRVKEEIERRS